MSDRDPYMRRELVRERVGEATFVVEVVQWDAASAPYVRASFVEFAGDDWRRRSGSQRRLCVRPEHLANVASALARAAGEL